MNPPELDIWILAGQSNMQGCGLLQGALEPDGRVWNFSSAGQWEVGCEPLHRVWESYTPVHPNFMRMGMGAEDLARDNAFYAEQENANRVGGAGLGLAFGQAMTAATGRPVGLIAAAHGGTSLAQWDFRLRDQGGESLYGGMLDRVKKALESGGQLKGLLWYQGESDATDADSVTYVERFKEWIAAVREDLGIPDLPVIIAQIGCVTRAPGDAPTEGWQAKPWERVREALLEIPQHVPNTHVTATIDLGLVDTIHIDTPGLVRLGQRMARLAQGQTSPRAVRVENVSTPHGYGGARIVCEGVTGGWLPRYHISGFEVRGADGTVHPSTYIINVDADPEDPRNFRVLLSQPLTEGVGIGYGLSTNPYCNAVDEADMPLCAFLPITAEG